MVRTSAIAVKTVLPRPIANPQADTASDSQNLGTSGTDSHLAYMRASYATVPEDHDRPRRDAQDRPRRVSTDGFTPFSVVAGLVQSCAMPAAWQLPGLAERGPPVDSSSLGSWAECEPHSSRQTARVPPTLAGAIVLLLVGARVEAWSGVTAGPQQMNTLPRDRRGCGAMLCASTGRRQISAVRRDRPRFALPWVSWPHGARWVRSRGIVSRPRGPPGASPGRTWADALNACDQGRSPRRSRSLRTSVSSRGTSCRA